MKSADIIYLFLMPEMLIKLREKFEKESKKGAVFISHGFKIEGWEKYCFKTIPNTPFPTYYYKIRDVKRGIELTGQSQQKLHRKLPG